MSYERYSPSSSTLNVEPMYTKSGRAIADSYVYVHAACPLTLSNTRRRNFILIDVIDESQNVERLLQALFEVQHVMGGRLTMLFTSRLMQLPF